MSFIMNLYRNINHNEWQFDFIYIFNTASNHKEEIESYGGKVKYIPKPNILTVFSFYHIIDKYLKHNSDKYCAIHLHEVLLGIIILPLAKKYKIPIRIVHSHSSVHSEKKSRALRNKILCLPIKKLSNVWLACSNKAANFLYGYKDAQKAIIVKNAIDLNKYRFNEAIRRQIRSELNLNNNLVIGHIGRFCIQKNQEFFIPLIKELKSRNILFRLIFVGDDSEAHSLHRILEKEHFNENVLFLGIRDDINKLLQAFDAFVLPSLFEGLPIVGIEAQAAGLPCIFSDTITQETKVTKNVEFLSLNDSPNKWIDQILKFQKENINRDTTQFLIDNKYDINNLVEQMLHIYTQNG